ncbi:hypothetical protein [Thermofilum pendens]|uniref:Uncharacterized protein n=1 Tax=Thermofilum pendens (strain DSM 2475 / Hrk 5) TaxID=368408 RepID=A1S1B5_THEPD|nr:hypothetical protein Tpen_1850 [Thermofilum pendens Hrk 5]
MHRLTEEQINRVNATRKLLVVDSSKLPRGLLRYLTEKWRGDASQLLANAASFLPCRCRDCICTDEPRNNPGGDVVIVAGFLEWQLFLQVTEKYGVCFETVEQALTFAWEVMPSSFRRL